MAKIQSMNTCIILLALVIACHAFLSAEGRQIKPMNNKEATTTKAKKETLPVPPITYDESAAAYKDDFRPTTPGNSPGIGHSHHTQNNEDVESKEAKKIHKKLNTDSHGPENPMDKADNEDVDSKVASTAAGHSVAGFVDDFRPTAPGHSPGIGHSLVKKNAEPKA